MRGDRVNQQEELFTYLSFEDSIPKNHPLRKINEFVEPILTEMWADFDGLYGKMGRPSIPPEQLLKALLLQVLYTIRSETQLVEQLRYNFLYRWFVGLGISDKVWDRSTFSKNRERLIIGEIADRFFSLVVGLAEEKGLISKEHFSVDGTLVEAWASLKSFQKKVDEMSSSSDDDKGPGNGKNPEVDFKGEKRSNETHESKSDPESKLYRKGSGREAKLSFMGHIMMENKNGLAVDTRFGQAGYHAELEAGIEMAQGLPGENKKTIGADKHYDQNYFSEALKNANISSHVAQNLHARKHTSSIDGRTTRHQSYEVSQQKRKRIEEIFGWLKTIGLLRRPMLKGSEKLGWMFSFGAAVYNLVRIKNLCATQY
jgi:transposase